MSDNYELADIPAFLLAENRPPDLEARADARRRAWHEGRCPAPAPPERTSLPRVRSLREGE